MPFFSGSAGETELRNPSGSPKHDGREIRPVGLRSIATVVQFRFAGGYPKKRQWALDVLTIETPWVLLLDADEVVPDALRDEIGAAILQPEFGAYYVTKQFHFLGKPFRSAGFRIRPCCCSARASPL